MTAHIGILSCGILLALTVLTGLLPTPTKGNAIGQRALQREQLGESPPEVISINDNTDYRELEEPLINDYSIKSKISEPGVDALIDYLLQARRMRSGYDGMMTVRGGRDEQPVRAQKKSYWKQCAFNAVSCFG